MLIRTRRASDVPSSEITDERVYLSRRELLGAAAVTAASWAGMPRSAGAVIVSDEGPERIEGVRETSHDPGEEPTWYRYATTYNNFYEFGTGKEDPAKYAESLVTRPWSVKIEGDVAKPGEVALEDLMRPHALEERIYRLRCVEAWSMVIPWVGIPLGDVLKRFEPSPDAKYVEFRTLLDPRQMRGQRREVLDWPYREGLRLDEAMNPLAILAVGMYGRVLPNQNGAPLRLVLPWKYGFKSIKSIVRIRLTRRQPATTWNVSAPREYGFYANVNPEVDHPRWSQARERRIGDLFFKRDTLMFNGYADEVADLYAGMDLRKNF